jgi:hypothetical protein
MKKEPVQCGSSDGGAPPVETTVSGVTISCRCVGILGAVLLAQNGPQQAPNAAAQGQIFFCCHKKPVLGCYLLNREALIV